MTIRLHIYPSYQNKKATLRAPVSPHKRIWNAWIFMQEVS